MSANSPADEADRSVHHVTSAVAKSQFLVATKTTFGAHALQPSAMLDIVESALREDSEIEIVKALRPRQEQPQGQEREQLQQFQERPLPLHTLVVRLTDEKAEQLRVAGLGRGVIVERDLLLSLSNPAVSETSSLGLLDATAIGPRGTHHIVEIQINGQSDTPLEGAQVVLYGGGLPAEAVTDQKGRARLTLPGNSLDTLRAIYVKPAADYWDIYVQQPNLLIDKLNVIQLTSLTTQQSAWGLKALRLDQLPAEYNGRGIKVAVVDSGIATSHPALTRVNTGLDISHPSSGDGWRSDPISHGTHTAGVIGGAAVSNINIRGIAPEAELIAAKVFPGGRFSDLIAAIDFAIQQQVDVINLSLGHDQSSEIVEQKLAEARAAGVAVIAAAGNTGGPVQFPARSPNVLAVSAIGKLGEFPASTYHAQTVLGDPRQIGPDGYFAAKFSSWGDQVGVAAPGVAVISTVSPSSYAVLDGTSVAAAHISGLAALILAHHPDFQERYRTRDARRVDRLFEVLRQSARPVYAGDLRRVGAGLPDAVRALGVDAQQQAAREAREAREHAQPPTQTLQQLRDQLRQLGVLGDQRDGAAASGVRPAQRAAASKNGTKAQGAQENGSARIVTALLLAELRKRMEEARLLGQP